MIVSLIVNNKSRICGGIINSLSLYNNNDNDNNKERKEKKEKEEKVNI